MKKSNFIFPFKKSDLGMTLEGLPIKTVKLFKKFAEMMGDIYLRFSGDFPDKFEWASAEADKWFAEVVRINKFLALK